MLTVQSTGAAIGLLLAGLVLLGLWPPCWNLVERKGRLCSHTFIDYGLTYMVVGSLASFTFGQLGPPHDDVPNFMQQLPLLDVRLATMLFLGGVLIVCGDVVLQYSVAFLGLSVGPPLFSATALVCGSTATYFIDGRRNSPLLLFPGVVCAVAAIALGAAAHVTKCSAPQEQQQQQPSCACGATVPGGGAVSSPVPVACDAVALQLQDIACRQHGDGRLSGDAHGHAFITTTHSDANSNLRTTSCSKLLAHAALPSDSPCALADASCGRRDHPSGGSERGNSKQDAALLPSPVLDSAELGQAAEDGGGLRQRRNRRETGTLSLEPPSVRSVQMADQNLHLGLLIVLPGAVLNALSYLAFQVAVNDKLALLPPGTPPPSVFIANFVFSLGFGLSSVIINAYFMLRPPMGTQRSSLMAWLRDNRYRGWSVLSGALAASGDMLQFLGGDAAGYAAAMLVTAFPLVGVLLGMLHFNEFKQASRTPRLLVAAEVVAYMAAVGLLAASADASEE